MQKQLVTSEKAPPPAGPYSPALRVGEWVFLSGQGGFDPKSGALAADVEAQTEQTLRNISAVLEAAGVSLDDVVACAVHLRDLADFPRFNAVYERWFAE